MPEGSGHNGVTLKVVRGGGHNGVTLKVVRGGKAKVVGSDEFIEEKVAVNINNELSTNKPLNNATTSKLASPRTNIIVDVPPDQINLVSAHNSISIFIVDSDVSYHCTPVTIPCINKLPCITPYSVSLPGSTIMHATHTAPLDLPWFPFEARHAYLFPDIVYRALVYVPQFCNNNFNVLFTPSHVYVYHKNNVVLTGTRTQPQGMWFIDLHQKQLLLCHHFHHHNNSIILTTSQVPTI